MGLANEIVDPADHLGGHKVDICIGKAEVGAHAAPTAFYGGAEGLYGFSLHDAYHGRVHRRLVSGGETSLSSYFGVVMSRLRFPLEAAQDIDSVPDRTV